MNRSVWIARLLGIGAVLESAMALVLLIDPAIAASLLVQSEGEAPGQLFGRIAGAGLLSLGIACWGARNTPLAPAGLGVAWAFVTYNLVACVTLVWAGVALASSALLAVAAAVLHGLVGMLLLVALLGRGEAATGD